MGVDAEGAALFCALVERDRALGVHVEFAPAGRALDGVHFVFAVSWLVLAVASEEEAAEEEQADDDEPGHVRWLS